MPSPRPRSLGRFRSRANSPDGKPRELVLGKVQVDDTVVVTHQCLDVGVRGAADRLDSRTVDASSRLTKSKIDSHPNSPNSQRVP